MSALYKLNKDELIKIILNMRETWTDEEMERELEDRKQQRRFSIVKRCLQNLKVVPQLREL